MMMTTKAATTKQPQWTLRPGSSPRIAPAPTRITTAKSCRTEDQSLEAASNATEHQDHEYRPGSEEQDAFKTAVDNILAEARSKLDALATDPSSAPTILGSTGALYPRRNGGGKWTAALALAGAYGATLGGSNRGDNNQGGQGQGQGQSGDSHAV